MPALTVTKQNFETEVINSGKTVLLDFWAPWCGPCRIVSPVIDEIADEAPHIKVGKINVDEERELAETYGITSIPTLAVVKEGKVVSKVAGVRAKPAILELLK
jgi:thioredoxin 1